MQNGGMMGGPGMPVQPGMQQQQPPQPAKTGLMGGLFGGISKEIQLSDVNRILAEFLFNFADFP